jgi:hypothetical protein
VAIIRELKTAGVPEHMRVNRKGQLGFLTCLRDHLAHAVSAHRAAALAQEYKPTVAGPVTGKLAKRPQLIALHGVSRRHAILRSPDMEVPSFKLDLIPPKSNHFRHPQAVPVSQQDHAGIPLPVSSTPRCGLQELRNLGRRKVLPRTQFSVRQVHRHSPAAASLAGFEADDLS